MTNMWLTAGSYVLQTAAKEAVLCGLNGWVYGESKERSSVYGLVSRSIFLTSAAVCGIVATSLRWGVFKPGWENGIHVGNDRVEVDFKATNFEIVQTGLLFTVAIPIITSCAVVGGAFVANKVKSGPILSLDGLIRLEIIRFTEVLLTGI